MLSLPAYRLLLCLFLLFNATSYSQVIQTGGGLHGVIGQPAAAQATQTFASEISFDGFIIDRYASSIKLINNTKVYGSPYLFPVPQKLNIFARSGNAYNIFSNYNLYAQTLEIFQGELSLEKLMIKGPNEIDSFTVIGVNEINGKNDLSFINSSCLGSSKKIFLQKLFTGKSFSLFKNYKMVLEDAVTDYGVSGIKNFVLKPEYFYLSIDKGGLTKLKLTSNAIMKEFPGKKISSFFSDQPEINESLLINIFTQLND